MISIDEAILHARQVAENKRADKRKVQNKPDKYRACEKCAEEHDQLADWLEELKAYRANEGMSENVYKAGCRFGYKKAIDEYTEYLKEIGKTGTDGWVPCFTPNSWKDDFLNKEYKEVTDLENIDVRR